MAGGVADGGGAPVRPLPTSTRGGSTARFIGLAALPLTRGRTDVAAGAAGAATAATGEGAALLGVPSSGPSAFVIRGVASAAVGTP
ncbi:hypothetical protein [Pseudactinotalea sp.]|uniref:hypothetical protein n=1 Tax=Pseudactinotalea sp. TaxID=1926260 RepID=UPI003B3B792D